MLCSLFLAVSASNEVNEGKRSKWTRLKHLCAGQRQLRLLQYERDLQDQAKLSESIRIHGVKESVNKTVKDDCLKVASLLEVSLTPNDFPSSFRREEGRALICIFPHRGPKQEIMAKKRKLKYLAPDISIHEDLTWLKHKTVKLALSSPNVTKIYTEEGIIHCRLNNSEEVTLKTPDDLLHPRLGLQDRKSVIYEVLKLNSDQEIDALCDDISLY